MAKTATSTWNLTKDFYSGPGDPVIRSDIQYLEQEAAALMKVGRDGSSNDSASHWLKLFHRYEELQARCDKIYTYGFLNHSLNTQDPAGRDLWFLAQEKAALIENATRQFKKLAKEFLPLTSDTKSFIDSLKENQRYQLTEREEEFLHQSNEAGPVAIRKAHLALTTPIRFNFPKESSSYLSRGEMTKPLESSNTEERRGARKALLEGFQKHSEVLAVMLSAIAQHAALEDKMRGAQYPEERIYHDRGISKQEMEDAFQFIKEQRRLGQEILALKKRELNLDRFELADTKAPIGNSQVIDTSLAREILIRAWSGFSPDFGLIVEEAFSEGRIDLEYRALKGQGAFCAALTPHLPPFVLTNFRGTPACFLVLAHEVGHYVHFRLAADQTYHSYKPLSIVTETAAIFSELLVTKFLQDNRYLLGASDISFTCLDRFFCNAFEEPLYARFQGRVFEKARKGAISRAELDGLWRGLLEETYAPATSLNEKENGGWQTISGYFRRPQPFAGGTYLYAALSALSWFDAWEIDSEHASHSIKSILRRGKDARPNELHRIYSKEKTRMDSWRSGISFIERQLNNLRRKS